MKRSAVVTVTAVAAAVAAGLIWMLASPRPSAAAAAQPKIEARKGRFSAKTA